MGNLLENYKYRLLVILTLSLIFTGFYYYFDIFSKDNKNIGHFPEFLLSITIIFFYVIPVVFLLRYLIKRLDVSRQAVMLSLILGFSACSLLGSEGNSLLSLILLSLNLPSHIIADWGSAITAPFAEEFAKGFVVVLVYFLCRKISLRTAFVCSLISGLGFQVSEDLAFIHGAAFGEGTSGFEQAFERVSYALGTHMVFAILFGVGVIALINKESGISGHKAVFWIVSSITLHFIWNSPLKGEWVIPLLGSIGLNLAYNVFTTVDRLDNNDKETSKEFKRS